MPSPPPPPPPPGPPPPPAPPPGPGFLGSASSSSKSKPPDRSALLSEIRTGTKLKKAVTNDRSAPIVDGGKSRVSNGGSATSAGQPAKLNGPGPMMMANLFAQGMPKLRQTGNRPGALSDKGFPHQSENFSSKSDSLESASPNSSQASTPSSTSNGNSTSSSCVQEASSRTQFSQGPRKSSFPNDVSVRGLRPAPPPASQKPNFVLSDSTSVSSGHQRNKSGPPLPNKPPSVTRSNSQTNLGPKVGGRQPRLPPSTKPPPPPKSPSMGKSGGPPAPPSKPPSLIRRQSLGPHDIKNGMVPQQLSTHMEVPIVAPLPSKLNVPPPPPRNFSAPNSLNQLHSSGGTSRPPSSLATNRSVPPPPPPPPPPQSAKMSIGVSRSSSMRPPPPPPPPPSSAPPPPPHRSTYPAPPSQTKAVPPPAPPSAPASVPPMPPQRNASTRQGSGLDDFESRFLQRFHSVHELPMPDRFTNSKKVYPSKCPANQAQRRQPPPPPPSGGNASSQPNLHIQLDSKMFASNTAQC